MNVFSSTLPALLVAIFCVGDLNAYDTPSIHLEVTVDLKLPRDKGIPLTLTLTKKSNQEVGYLYEGAKLALTLYLSESERKHPIFPVPRPIVLNAVYTKWLRPGESKIEIVYLPFKLADTVQKKVVASIIEPRTIE